MPATVAGKEPPASGPTGRGETPATPACRRQSAEWTAPLGTKHGCRHVTVQANWCCSPPCRQAAPTEAWMPCSVPREAAPARWATNQPTNPQVHRTCRVSELSYQHRRWLGQVPRSPASKDTARLTQVCAGGTWLCASYSLGRISLAKISN